MQVLDDVYGAHYQRDSLQDAGIAAFDVIADELVKMFKPKTAMDVGCGGGALIRGLLARGVDAYGIEGSSHAKQYMPERIFIHDLREKFPGTHPFPMPKSYDLVTCTDVGEHIEEECHGPFVETLQHLCGHGIGTLIFGAAGEGQDGLGHVACKHPTYWIDKIEEAYSLELDAKASEELRNAIKSRHEHSFAWWVSKNLMVFTGST